MTRQSRSVSVDGSRQMFCDCFRLHAKPILCTNRQLYPIRAAPGVSIFTGTFTRQSYDGSDIGSKEPRYRAISFLKKKLRERFRAFYGSKITRLNLDHL